MREYGNASIKVRSNTTADKQATVGRRVTDPLEKAVTRYSFTAYQEQKRPTRAYRFPVQARQQTAEDKARLERLREAKRIKSPFAPF